MFFVITLVDKLYKKKKLIQIKLTDRERRMLKFKYNLNNLNTSESLRLKYA